MTKQEIGLQIAIQKLNEITRDIFYRDMNNERIDVRMVINAIRYATGIYDILAKAGGYEDLLHDLGKQIDHLEYELKEYHKETSRSPFRMIRAISDIQGKVKEIGWHGCRFGTSRSQLEKPKKTILGAVGLGWLEDVKGKVQDTISDLDEYYSDATRQWHRVQEEMKRSPAHFGHQEMKPPKGMRPRRAVWNGDDYDFIYLDEE